ncbi:MAG: excinuclease ABC subunit UvrC [Firmicutes bacterium]|nr:excinuclease ABC subunit UvrC [Bacillota bacterium]
MFKDELKLVPHLPGSYQMINKDGVIIYVGKAKDLNKRLHSYFRGTVTGKTALMVSEVDHFTYIVTKTETESFILELNLIKKHDPKYNILLKDDKTYPYIEYVSKPYPSLKVSRYTSIKRSDKKQIFGPYPNAYAARRIVNLINRLYPLKKCDGNPKKLCLYYHIGECLGYCVKNPSLEKIMQIENEILSFLRGNDKILIDKIMEKIEILSQNLNFEKALELRNELNYIKVVLDKQKVELHDFVNRDVISFYHLNGYLSVQIFFIRNGKLLGGHSNIINMVASAEEELNLYIYSYYQSHEKPKEILTTSEVNKEILSDLLNINFITPLKGKKKELLNMCYMNAKLNLEREIESFKQDEKRTIEANNRLGKLLNISSLNTIETFDNSNLFGSFSVSGMVVFKNGKPSKNDYRKFKISLDKNDDYHMMEEVIYRRYFRLLVEKKPMPDLIFVDGGINQINACKSSLEKLNINIPVCGLKKDDHHRTKTLIDGTLMKEIDLTSEIDIFNYLTRIQDEVHRFTINYHKQIRSKGALGSILGNVDGIGEKRRKELLKKYGSLEKIKEASTEELTSIIPVKVAEELKKYLEEMNAK